MKLIIGGIFSGKYERLLSLGFGENEIADGASAPYEEAFAKPALYKLNGLIRRMLEDGKDPQPWILEQVKAHPEITIVCDEVGGGVVPIDKLDREYREAVGRICCEIAKQAESVERIYCGLVTELKAGEKDAG